MVCVWGGGGSMAGMKKQTGQVRSCSTDEQPIGKEDGAGALLEHSPTND